jgi:mannose-1-phosphate guanylyltransferase
MVYGVIMAGGSGTRFWPRSRRSLPKQLLTITGERSLIRATVDRLGSVIPAERIMVVAGDSHAQKIRNELPELPDHMVTAEPVGRNTAPCIALAAFKLLGKDPDAIMVVLPADHMIGNEAAFSAAMKAAIEAVSREESLLTFGIVPNRPETGYGYIKLGAAHSTIGSATLHSVERFVEKPDRTGAEEYLSSGDYLWNSGMFVWKAVDIIRALDRHLPDLSAAIRGICEDFDTPGEARAIQQAYQRLEPASIDFGVMEKACNVLCLPLDADWDDVGSWSSMEDYWEHDKDGNAIDGAAISIESADCIVASPHKLAAFIGVEDLIIVDTPDALLVCRKDRAQDIRKLQEILEQRGYGHLL